MSPPSMPLPCLERLRRPAPLKRPRFSQNAFQPPFYPNPSWRPTSSPALPSSVFVYNPSWRRRRRPLHHHSPLRRVQPICRAFDNVQSNVNTARTSSTPTALSPPSPKPRPSVTREILALSIPALGALALDPFLSLVDTAFVGRLGVSPIAGVGLATLLLNVVFALFNFLCISITPIVANAVHANPSDHTAASRPISLALWLSINLGLLTACALFLFARPLAVLLRATDQVLPYAVPYLRARALAIPFALSSFVLNGAMRAFRDLRTPFVVACLSNMINVLLDVVLMFHLQMGVLGAAIATSVAQVVAFTLMFCHLTISTNRLKISHIVTVFFGRSLSSVLAQIRPLMSAGVMLAIRTCSMLSAVAFATTSAAAMGHVNLAAFELCRQLWVFNATLLDSFATAAQALVASAMAARAIRHARFVAKRAVLMSVVVAVAIALPAVLLGHRLPAVFSSSAQVQATAAKCIQVAALCAPINGAVFAMDGVLAACADYKYLALGIAAAAAATCVAIAIVRTFHLDVTWLWAALNVLMIGRAVVLFLRFFSPRGPMALQFADASGKGVSNMLNTADDMLQPSNRPSDDE